jgi:hypothetical protein
MSPRMGKRTFPLGRSRPAGRRFRMPRSGPNRSVHRRSSRHTMFPRMGKRTFPLGRSQQSGRRFRMPRSGSSPFAHPRTSRRRRRLRSDSRILHSRSSQRSGRPYRSSRNCSCRFGRLRRGRCTPYPHRDTARSTRSGSPAPQGTAGPLVPLAQSSCKLVRGPPVGGAWQS